MQLFVFTDGGSRGNPGPAALGGVVYQNAQRGDVVYEFSQYIGVGTNNEADYKAFLHAVEWVAHSKSAEKIKKCTWHLDSKLVVEQINKRWKIKEPRMRILAEQCWRLLEDLPFSFSVVYVPREENAVADALVNQALDAAAE